MQQSDESKKHPAFITLQGDINDRRLNVPAGVVVHSGFWPRTFRGPGAVEAAVAWALKKGFDPKLVGPLASDPKNWDAAARARVKAMALASHQARLETERRAREYSEVQRKLEEHERVVRASMRRARAAENAAVPKAR